MTTPDELLPVSQADFDLAEKVVDAANIVSHGGYYEADISRVAETLARHRQSSGVDEAKKRTAINGILAGLLLPLVADPKELIALGNQACTEILASLSTPTAEPTDLFAENAKKSGAETLDGLEWTEDGYSLRTPYDGDADDDGRSIIVGGEIVVTFADSDEGDKYRERILRALTTPPTPHEFVKNPLIPFPSCQVCMGPENAEAHSPPTPDRIGKDAVRETVMDQSFANIAPIEWGDFEWQSLAAALLSHQGACEP